MRSRLMIEAAVAAGPRKSAEAYRGGVPEMCEDYAGYRTLGEYIIFWVCDGRSNSHELPSRPGHPGFSARILAWDLAGGFARLMTASLMNAEYPRLDVYKSLLGDIAGEWQKRLGNYLADVKQKGNLELVLGRMPLMGDGSRRLQWTSTFLGGVYNELEQTLDIINIGEGAAFIIGKEPQKVRPKENHEILIATLTYEKELKIEICPMETEASWEHFEDVTCFLALSDGMAEDLDVLLDQLETRLKSEPIEEVRRQLLIQGELTYDDRSMILGRLMPERRSQTYEDSALQWYSKRVFPV